MNPWLAIFHPSTIAKNWMRKEDGWSLKTKLELDWFPHPQYAYALNQATIQALRFGIPAISAIEFGVGDGSGLVAMENIAAALAKESGVAIHTYGFDVGEARPRTDERDLPYLGERKPMDKAAADAKLKSSTLIVGDLSETVPAFFENLEPPTVGLVSFNFGDYTTTAEALRIFDTASETRLPRTFAYFGNVIGNDDALHCEHAGELLAIERFNHSHEQAKLARINGLSHKRVFRAAWQEQLFVLHDFAHPRYGEFKAPEGETATPSSDG